jgi:hypothetical protein
MMMRMSDVSAASQSANPKKKTRRRRRRRRGERTCISLACSLSLVREQAMLLLLRSLTLSATRNKYHKWNREYHESAQDEKRLSLSC